MPNIHLQLLIEAPAEIIYNAVTKHEGLSAWWTPGTQAKVQLNSLLRFPFGEGYFKEMKLTVLKPLEQVEWNCIKGASEWIGTNISFKLLPGDKQSLLHAHPEMLGQIEQQKTDKATLLIFHHDDWKAYTPMFAECSFTWVQFLKSLKLLCETGKGRPWPDQHHT